MAKKTHKKPLKKPRKKNLKQDRLFDGMSKEEIDHMTEICISMADAFDDIDGMRAKTKMDSLKMDELTREVRKSFRKSNK